MHSCLVITDISHSLWHLRLVFIQKSLQINEDVLRFVKECLKVKFHPVSL